jgi:hypothetical protein
MIKLFKEIIGEILITYHNKLQKDYSKIHLLDRVILGEKDMQS